MTCSKFSRFSSKPPSTRTCSCWPSSSAAASTALLIKLFFTNPGESLRLFRLMSRVCGSVAAADSFTLSLSLQSCGRSENLSTGSSMHAHVMKLGFFSDLFVQTALVEMYAKSGDVKHARHVLDSMPQRDVVVYNSMLAEYVNCGDILEARRLFDEMPERDLISWNTMIHGYAVSGDLVAAREMFDRTSERDLISWSSIISAYAQCRRSSEALTLFHEMQIYGFVPDKITMVSVLSACGDMGALGMGRVVHKLIEKNGIEVDIRLGTSLIDMYAKCGDVENSLGVFYSMSEKDVLTWSAMITGLANHGLGKDALDLFSSMILEGIKPTDVTFVGVLSACNHACLLIEGRAHFNSMSKVYGIKPKLEHYGCMVDLFGRSGHIEEARKLLISMPFEPDAVVWRTLLGACRIHKIVDVAEESIMQLIKLEPHVDGHYVLLSNIYAQANRWDDVAAVRRSMRDKSIMKIPGCTSIELDNVIYEFIAGDRSHNKSSEIYMMLEEIIDRLRKAGYRPMTTVVLQDVDEQWKESILFQHSEKLAVAFGFLFSSPNSTLRIMKNLRVCEDCHLAFKLISLIYERKIIVRDRNRFHHFNRGVCSCKDYW